MLQLLCQEPVDHMGIFSQTLRSALKFLDIPEIRDISRHSDFSLEDLKLGSLDLFVCAPTNAIREELSNWFRLLTVMSLDLFGKDTRQSSRSVSLLPSMKCQALVYIEAIETSAPVMRSYGVRLLAIAPRTLEKLQKAYPKGWRGFIGNADAVYWMATNENENSHLSVGEGWRKDTGRESWF